MRRLLPIVLTLSILPSCAGTRIPIIGDTTPEAWCGLYFRLKPLVDSLPDCGTPCAVARLSLSMAHPRIVEWCARDAAGGKVDAADLAPYIAPADRSMAELLADHERRLAYPQTVRGETRPAPVSATIDLSEAIRALRRHEAEATRVLSR